MSGRPTRTLLPRPPDLTRGLCVTLAAKVRGWWTSDRRDEREAARRLCSACPVLAACRQYALSLPVTDTTTYAGMTWHERVTARRAAKPLASASARAS